MATGKADGSVIIKAVLDTGGIQNALGKIGGTLKTLTGSVGGLTKQTANLQNQFLGLGRTAGKVGAAIASVFAVSKIVNFAKEAIDLGSDLAEVQNVVENVFTTMTDKVNDFATAAASTYGLSETMAKRYVGTFGAMAKAFGFTEQEAYDMSTTLTGLAGDVASFYNLDQDTAYTKLKSVFSGETESLKDLGIVMTQTALDSYALQQGIGKTTSQMTEQEKVALRYRFILDQLSTASGDFARTSDGWANQTRILRLQVDSLKASLGQGLINLLTPALKVINIIIGRLATLANAFKSFTELITGKKSSGQTSAAAAGLSDISGAASSAADNTSDLADATDDAAGATKNAVKQQKAYLSGLDEMKKFTVQEDSGSSGGSGGGKGSGGGGGASGLPSAVEAVDYGKLAEGNSVVDELGESFSKLADLIKSKDWEGLGKYMADGLNVGMQKLYDFFNWSHLGPRITEFTDAFTRTLNSFVGNLDTYLGGRTLGTIINTAVNTINQLKYGIDWVEIGNKIAEGFNGLMDEVDFNKLGQAISGKFYLAWQTFRGFIEEFKFDALGTHIAELMEGMMDGAPKLTELGNTICKLVNGAFDVLGAWLRRFPFKKFATNISDGINTMIMGIDWEADGQTFNELLVKLGDLLTDIVEKVKWEELGSGIGTFLSNIDWETHLKKAWNIIKTIVLGLAKGLGKTSGGRFILGLIAFKVTSTMIMPFVNSLAGALVGNEAKTAVGNSLASLLKSGFSVAGKALSGAGKLITAGIESGGLLSAITEGGLLIGTVEVTRAVAKFVEVCQGGNGVLTQFGAATHDFAAWLSEAGSITTAQKEELDGLIEEWETAGLTNEEIANNFIQKLMEFGVSAEQAQAILESFNWTQSKAAEETEMLSGMVDQLGEGFSRNAATLNFSLASYENTNEVFNNMWDVLYDLYNQGGETAAMFPALSDALTQVQGTSGDAQQAFDNLVQVLIDAGVAPDALIQAMQEKFPEAVPVIQEASGQAETAVESIGIAAETAGGKVGTAMQQMNTAATTEATAMASSVGGKAQEMANDTIAAYTEIANATGDTFEGIAADAELYSGNAASSVSSNWSEAKTSTTNEWGGSTTEIEKNLNSQNAMVGEKLRAMHHVVDWYTQKFQAMFSDCWKGITNGLNLDMTSMVSTVTSSFQSMTQGVIDAFWGMAYGMSSPLNNIVSMLNSLIVGAQNAQNTIASLLSFNIQLSGFMAQKVGWSSMWLHIPQRYANYRVPYLASGAVIPPNAPFMAVLGDQKRGNNIEMPENLLRQIVREESGGQNRSYTFVAQLDGRTLFSKVVTEAELRQMQTGRNPFEL